MTYLYSYLCTAKHMTVSSPTVFARLAEVFWGAPLPPSHFTTSTTVVKQTLHTVFTYWCARETPSFHLQWMEHYDKATLLPYQTLNPKCEAKCEAHSVLSEIKVPNPSGFSCVLELQGHRFSTSIFSHKFLWWDFSPKPLAKPSTKIDINHWQ